MHILLWLPATTKFSHAARSSHFEIFRSGRADPKHLNAHMRTCISITWHACRSKMTMVITFQGYPVALARPWPARAFFPADHHESTLSSSHYQHVPFWLHARHSALTKAKRSQVSDMHLINCACARKKVRCNFTFGSVTFLASPSPTIYIGLLFVNYAKLCHTIDANNDLGSWERC
ncbi:hypothetical protein K437DRAFT_189841 [Tilletiaria anomala UBC 951]|uniref:Uncharacterized protein n=1 Tax=Tilletiaria anomala (strain ATCC 24038 / CBS 436.72 / UBC 951) TaxID=1037660 RepID=A0A066VF39_TILAU|nr:uncharacterized protein K437DRAFT_189841 [Tilletiaria anomala UBC 951]KDN40332.1 hypothetical protein K437DRAFT_189841 [Tilletiaria anomala UBC 951]